jgi:hypothetical protein
VPQALSPANSAASPPSQTPDDPAPAKAASQSPSSPDAAAPPRRPTASAAPPASAADQEDSNTPEQLDLAAFAIGPSAVDDALGLAVRMRLQMVSAMAGFSGDRGAMFDDQGQRLKDPAAMALLTHLPDYRIVRPAASNFS